MFPFSCPYFLNKSFYSLLLLDHENEKKIFSSPPSSLKKQIRLRLRREKKDGDGKFSQFEKKGQTPFFPIVLEKPLFIQIWMHEVGFSIRGRGWRGGIKNVWIRGRFLNCRSGRFFSLSIEWLTSHLLALISYTFSLFLPSSLHYPKREILTERGREKKEFPALISTRLIMCAGVNVRNVWIPFFRIFCGELRKLFRAPKNQSITYLLKFISLRVKKWRKSPFLLLFPSVG